MPNIYSNEHIEYAGNHYYKSDSGLLLEAEDWMKSKTNGEMGIKNLAKQVAKRTKKRTSTIKTPFTKTIQYEVERKVEVEDGFFIFKSKRLEKVVEQRAGTNVDYKDIPIDGWILKIYYIDVDTVNRGRRLEQDVTKWFYVLKKDGSLSVFKIGYVIEYPKTNSEKARFYHELTEEPMTFDRENIGLGSAYLLDLKPIKWEKPVKKNYNEMLYFKRNYPIKIGQCEYEGESYFIHQNGEGLVNALNKLSGNKGS